LVIVLTAAPNVQARKGGFSQTRPEELLSNVLRAAWEKPGLDPKLIEDIAVGNVLPPGGGASAARMASLHAGIPNTAALNTLNRQCSSGLSAVNQIALEIKAGQIDIGIGALSRYRTQTMTNCYLFTGAGVESMTFGYGPGAAPDGYSESVLSSQEAEDCLIPMGITSENVAADFGVSRQKQDAFAAESFRRAAEANKAGKFKGEILPIKVKVEKDEKEFEVVVDRDDGIRDGVTAESLSKLKPAFSKTGTTHAGTLIITKNHTHNQSAEPLPQETHHKSRTVLLQFSWLAAQLHANLTFLLSESSSLRTLSVYRPESWVLALPMPFLSFSRRPGCRKTMSTFSRSTKLSLVK